MKASSITLADGVAADVLPVLGVTKVTRYFGSNEDGTLIDDTAAKHRNPAHRNSEGAPERSFYAVAGPSIPKWAIAAWTVIYSGISHRSTRRLVVESKIPWHKNVIVVSIAIAGQAADDGATTLSIRECT
jgi:hypothetical protein